MMDGEENSNIEQKLLDYESVTKIEIKNFHFFCGRTIDFCRLFGVFIAHRLGTGHHELLPQPAPSNPDAQAHRETRPWHLRFKS
jgi:hypothetical protein